MTVDDFGETVERLERLYHMPAVPARMAGLRRTYRLLALLGEPQRAFRSVHITGSSGKGSTASMVGSILTAAGFRTGIFRSPHLLRYTERVAIDGQEIERAEWLEAFNRVWLVVERLSHNDLPDYTLGRPSLFDVLFAMACVHFREAGVDWAVMEAGIGGRLDPTNALAPDVAAITNVSLEHTQILGDTVAAIAREKAAIVKPGGMAVTAAEESDALAVIRRRTRLVRAPLLDVGAEVTVDVADSSFHGQTVMLSHEDGRLEARLGAAGEFQARNAATAFGIVVQLRRRGVIVSDSAVRAGLEATRIPGRLQLLSEQPLVLLDGAHNPAAAHQVCLALSNMAPDHRWHLLFAGMADKDIEAMAAALSPIANCVTATRAPGTDRSAAPERIAGAFAARGVPAVGIEDAGAALERALAAGGSDGPVLVTGSMYLVGWAGANAPVAARCA